MDSKQKDENKWDKFFDKLKGVDTEGFLEDRIPISRLSKAIDEAKSNEGTFCNMDKEVRKFGQLEGKSKIDENFDKESDKINSMFYDTIKYNQ